MKFSFALKRDKNTTLRYKRYLVSDIYISDIYEVRADSSECGQKVVSMIYKLWDLVFLGLVVF